MQHHGPGTDLSALHYIISFNPPTALYMMYHYPHFKDEELS